MTTAAVETPIADRRIIDLAGLKRMCNIWRMKGERIVFTNGCFDILHRGHVEYLQQAAALGDRLIIAVNSDASVRRQGKSADRPLNDEQSRAKVLAALRGIDAVTIFEEDTPLGLIEAVMPDVLVKGGDWSVDRIVGSAVVRANGGTVHSLKLVEGFSTTALVEKIRRG